MTQQSHRNLQNSLDLYLTALSVPLGFHFLKRIFPKPNYLTLYTCYPYFQTSRKSRVMQQSHRTWQQPFFSPLFNCLISPLGVSFPKSNISQAKIPYPLHILLLILNFTEITGDATKSRDFSKTFFSPLFTCLISSLGFSFPKSNISQAKLS